MGKKGFITAGHCLAPVGSDTNDTMSQPVYAADYIGTETIDPPSFYLGCYPPFDCKFSDSVWIEHTGGLAQQGQIAQTLSWNGTTNCCDTGCAACQVSTSNPRFQIYGSADLVEGMQVEKVGRTSGWTTGILEDDCNDEYSSNSGVWYLCMGIADYVHADGDSGSPVFYWWWFNGVNTVEFLGVHSGNTGGGDARFSPWDQVTNDLGAIDIRYHSYFNEWAAATNARAIPGDFNNDNKTDIALVGGVGWTTIPVAFSQGDGTFAITNFTVSDFPAWVSHSSVKVVSGDFDGDGDDDLVGLGYPGWTTTPVALSNGNGHFTVQNPANSVLASLADDSGVKVMTGNLNGDTKDDLILVGGANWNFIYDAYALFSSGSVSFSTPTWTSHWGFPYWAASAGVMATTGDFDGNGRADVALSGWQGWTTIPLALRQTNNGWLFTNQAVDYFPGWSPYATSLLSGRVNSDTLSDLMLTGGSGWWTIPLATSLGGGNFSVTNPSASQFATDAQLAGAKAVSGDFNNDGRTDVALVGGNGQWTIPIAWSNGNGTFGYTNKLCE